MGREDSPGEPLRKAISPLLVGVGGEYFPEEAMARRIAVIQVDEAGRVFQAQDLVHTEVWRWRREPRAPGDQSGVLREKSEVLPEEMG